VVTLLAQTIPETSGLSLTTEETSRLHQLERVVEKHLDGFLAVGRALSEIRSSRLYRQNYSTFESYLRERWALSRSRADELIRSTTTAELLLATTGSAEGATPLPPDTSELVLRPISALPTGDLQAQAWRLSASVSPKGRPTHTTTAKVTRMIRESIEGDSKRATSARELMFTRPISRLAAIDTFDVNVCLLHVKDSAQAERISHACAVVGDRCTQIQAKLNERFPDARLTSKTHPAH
jgi:hypothetical protein